MMRTILVLWLTPSALFWSWHLLATTDIAFGREFHDHVMRMYGQLLGIDPGAIPMLFAKAVATDGLLVLGIFLFRRRKAIGGFIRRASGGKAGIIRTGSKAGPAHLAG